jgi:L-ascorbate metabolism protein UlaG (beta-lactamase superfamily)
MPVMIMDRLTKKQAKIEHRKTTILAEYPRVWRQMVSEWQRPEESDRAWLLYSANYLFCTQGIRWALDPLTLHWRIPKAPQMDTAQDLRHLSFIILTHCHADHLDLDLVHNLRVLPILWVIPEPLLAEVAKTGLSRAKIIVPKAMEPLELEGIKITPFDGLHWEVDSTYPDGRRGVPATGYLVEFSGKRWLFPGDTRTFDASQLPSFGPVDGLFAHLWLGRGCALNEKPPLLDAFCSFCLELQPKRIIVTHLEEFGRTIDEYWDKEHFQPVRRQILERAPERIIESAYLGERVDL